MVCWLKIVPLCGVGLLGIRWYVQGKQFNQKNLRIDGYVVIVTGCNTGIGKETVIDLARRGARVYMACRDFQRCEETRLEIVSKTGNPNVFNRRLDLSSMASVREFAEEFKAEETRLDILINNAGVGGPRRLTVDGYETQFATNHLGPFLLTNLLLDLLKSSAPSRIVNVSSVAHYKGKIPRDDLMNEHNFRRLRVYAQTKLANVLFTRELSKRLVDTGVTANSLHPGFVHTEIFRSMKLWLKVLMFPVFIFAKTPKSGAQTTLTVALDPRLKAVSGKYFDNCTIKQESKTAQDDETAEWLWNKSAELTGLEL